MSGVCSAHQGACPDDCAVHVRVILACLTAERDKVRDQLATAQVIIAAMELERDTARELRVALTAERDKARVELARQSAARVAVDATENAEVVALRALLASWLDDDDDGALWSDWPKRLSEDQREALACAWTGLPPGSCWVRAALATGEKESSDE